MRRTQIICTLGPASDNARILRAMNEAGMTIARLNMSHGTHATHQATIDKLAPMRKKGTLKILVDTKGPEMRILNFENGAVFLENGQKFTFTTRNVLGNKNQVSLAYKHLVKQVKKGDTIFANNGLLVLKVDKVTPTDIITTVEFGGKLSDHKGLNVPGIVPDTPFLSENDKSDLLFAIQNHADYVALSFVSDAKNVSDARKFLNQNGGENIQIISKIENAYGVLNIEKILDVTDAVMIARGDMGVEIPMEKIPPIQKKLISLCNVKRKFVVVATEMLESMTTSLRPTRAEITDVATAVYEEANATMLSGETAVGIDPVNVVATMAKIIDEAEKHIYGVKVVDESF